MAKPNYGYLKRQKQLKKQKKKELKARKRQEGDTVEQEPMEGVEGLDEALLEIKEHMAGLEPDSELRTLAEHILQNQEVFPPEIINDMAQDFLERVNTDVEDIA